MKRILYIVLAVTLASCTSIEVHRTLKDVETYIAERPDSALVVIESIETPALKTKGLRAHHALLHAMALDKNYIDVTDDSLALTAVKYYEKHGPKKNLARSLYYLALSYYYDGRYDKSIIELSKAEPVAERNDSLYLGFVKVLQASIYGHNYNEVAELDALEKALETYTQLDAEYYINVAKLDLSRSYISNNRYDDASEILEDLLSFGKLNESMRIQAMRNYAFLMATKYIPEYELAVSYYDEVSGKGGDQYMSEQDYWILAYALSELNRTQESQEIVNRIFKRDSSGTAYYFRYLIAKKDNNPTESLSYLEEFVKKNNYEVIQILKQSVATIQKDYYQSQYEIAGMKATNRLIIIICIVTAIVFLTIISWIAIIRYKRKKEQEKDNYIRYAEEVNRQLKDLKNNTYSSLQKKYISLYKSRYETLGALFDQYVQSGGRVDSEQIIYKKVVSLIDELRSDIGTIEDFEAMLDADLEGIMTKLHTELPDLKKKDYSLFAYLALGFDATIISHFMDCTVNTVYIRKSRLKKAIEDSAAEHKSIFLEIIS